MSRKVFIGLLIVLSTGFFFITPVFSQNDGAHPVGATTAQDLYSPVTAGRGGFTTSRGGAAASALNPAAEGETQRIIFDFGYIGLPRFGDDAGYGFGALNVGAVFPTKYAVFGGSLRFMRSYFDHVSNDTSLDNDIFFEGNLNAAKELYPGMSIGAGLNAGYNTGNTWTLSGDLGFRYNMGDIGPLENFTWAVAARSLGRSWIPPMFTPAAGVAFDFLHLRGTGGKADPLKIAFAADLALPTFQNLAVKAGLSFLIAETINVSTSSHFNLRETLNGLGPSPIPSIGIGAIFRLKSGGKTVAGALPSDGELAVDLAAKPLYGKVWGTGGGVTWTVGVLDRNPPRIAVDYPEPVWVSPNNDGKTDYLEFPLTIEDERYIAEWVMEIRAEQSSAEQSSAEQSSAEQSSAEQSSAEQSSAEQNSAEGGTVVREYRNKELRPETQGMRNIIDRVKAVKTGVDVPSSILWDGIFESGETAPDGKYFFTITSKDDNGNTATKGPFEVNVDCTPPSIALSPFAENMNIFAPGSGGSKDTLTITQTGSREDHWESGIYDALGEKVRTYSFEDREPVTIVWDGKDDSGSIVPDGVYSYRIRSTDKALNSGEGALENIIVNTIRPAVALSITDAFFSPNGDGVKDTETITLAVPVREGITGWELEVRDFNGDVKRSYTGTAAESGTSAVPSRIEFDGRDDSGRLLPEAAYSANLSVRYRNGYNSTALSPGFNLDITSPRSAIQIDDRDEEPGRPAVFSPDNSGVKDELILVQEGSYELTWIGEIRRRGETEGPPSRTFRFSGTPPRRHFWDGVTNSGALAPDGFYTYELYSTDPAGNTGRSNRVEFELNTRDTPIFVSTDLRSFSPNGDGAKDTINVMPQIQERDGILTWRIEILNLSSGVSGAAPVYTFEGREPVPASVNWNGRTSAGTTAPDGTYAAKLDMEYRSGNRPTALSMAFDLDTVPPRGEASTPYSVFAPNGNGSRDTIPIRVNTEGEDEWNAVITGAAPGADTPVRTWNWTGRAPAVPLVWDGKDEAGNVVSDGAYTFTLSSTDEAGNSARRTINNITVDARIPKIFLTASSSAIAPRPDEAEAMRFNIIALPSEGVDSWKLELRDENNTLVKTFPSPAGGSGVLPPVVPWDGKDERGDILEGRFTPALNVGYAKGDVVDVSAPPVTVDISGPILGVHSSPEYFSPDNDGVDDELLIQLSARDASPIADWSFEIRETEGTRQLFWRIEGRGSPSDRIIWDGRSNRGELVQSASDYEYIYRASDTLGNSSAISGRLSTDVLVIRDGDILRIQVPSITFRANYADFVGIPQERLDTNVRVLRRIAEILNRFRDYRITVEGHANPVLGTAREENETLIPLSLARAQFVMEHLGGLGVSRNRLSPVGRGGTRNVANPQDQSNNWKNRRVEFLLIK